MNKIKILSLIISFLSLVWCNVIVEITQQEEGNDFGFINAIRR